MVVMFVLASDWWIKFDIEDYNAKNKSKLFGQTGFKSLCIAKGNTFWEINSEFLEITNNHQIHFEQNLSDENYFFGLKNWN